MVILRHAERALAYVKMLFWRVDLKRRLFGYQLKFSIKTTKIVIQFSI